MLPDLLCTLLSVYSFILIARVILSWVQAFGRVPEALGPVVKVVYDLTEPVMGPLRRVIPPLGMFDISVLVAFLILGALRQVVCVAG